MTEAVLEREKPRTTTKPAATSGRVGKTTVTEAFQVMNYTANTPTKSEPPKKKVAPTPKHFPPLQNNAKQASAKTQREKDLERLELITSRVMAGEELKAVILDVCADVAEILEDQTQQERSLIGELSHSQKFSKRIDEVFGKKYGVKHNDSPQLEEVISNEELGEFSITIKKIGETERNRRVVDAMLSNPKLRPIAYANRPKINGKKASLEDFFNTTYGAYRDSGSIYLNEIKILDEGLYNYLGSAGKHITSTMKKCTDHVNADIALLANVSKRAESVMKSLYGR